MERHAAGLELGPDAVLLHQPFHALLAGRKSKAVHFPDHEWAAIGTLELRRVFLLRDLHHFPLHCDSTSPLEDYFSGPTEYP